MPTSKVLVLDKALALFSAVTAEGGARPGLAVAAELGLPRATAHRLLASLTRAGFLAPGGRGLYVAGPALAAAARAASPHDALILRARPALARLAARTGLTAHLGVFDGEMVTYLVKAARDPASVFTREGGQLEAYCSAIGKMLLALLPETAQARYLAGGPFVALTANTITDPAALHAELARTRARGYALDEAEIAPGLYCIAAPIFNADGAAIAAISLSGAEADPARRRAALVRLAATLGQRLNAREQAAIA